MKRIHTNSTDDKYLGLIVRGQIDVLVEERVGSVCISISRRGKAHRHHGYSCSVPRDTLQDACDPAKSPETMKNVSKVTHEITQRHIAKLYTIEENKTNFSVMLLYTDDDAPQGCVQRSCNDSND